MPKPAGLISVHRFFGRTSFYALALSTLIAFGFLLARVQITHTMNYRFLVWNLFLAWVPFWCATAVLWLVESRARQRPLIALLSGLWLIFFPNAPYIVTDFKHLFDTPH